MAMKDFFNQRYGPLPSPSIQPIRVKKIKRNLKTRQQYKRRKAQSNVMDQSDSQEVEHTYVADVKKEASKHVVLYRMVPWDWSVTSRWHAAIQSDILINGMIMIGCWTNGRRRMGVG